MIIAYQAQGPQQGWPVPCFSFWLGRAVPVVMWLGFAVMDHPRSLPRGIARKMVKNRGVERPPCHAMIARNRPPFISPTWLVITII